MNRFLTLAVAALLPLAASAETTTWTIDPVHSTSSFAVKHLVITTVHGQFGKTSGTVQFDEQDPTKSKAEATIDVTTINTQNDKRDADLKSAGFFDAANHPTMTFKSTKVEKVGDGKFKVTGDLTIRGNTKPVTLDVTASQAVKGMQGELRRAFSASGRINRQDFGLTYSKTIEAGPIVGDNVDLLIEVEAVKEKGGETAKKP
jgi:polyisoprenoid-binding protein YceI